MKIPAALTTFLFAGLPLHAEVRVVDTASNNIDAGDGKISLLEALTAIQDGDVIAFNISGAGPHYIATPEGGYPVISKSGITIDGYTQTGASRNTAGLREPNNAQLRIVLDSRTTTPGARRTVLDYDGFSLSESAVIGLVDAAGVTIRGLAFIGVAGSGENFDPSVYNIGFVRNCPGAKVQGCWFGLDPGVTSWTPGPDGSVAGVYGARSAVASFRGDGLDSIGLTFGNDGNDNIGNGRGEFNICMAQRLAVHLQTRAVRISGNWINFFPDGSFLNLEKQGLVLEDDTLEAIENGNPEGMLIGTDGNGAGDADEGNIIGPLDYTTVVECWGSNVGIVFAGNSVGVGLDNLPAFTLPGTNLFSIRKNSDLRVGSGMNGTGDAAEANHIHGLGSAFISWHSSNIGADPDKAAVVNVRGNNLVDNYGAIPHDASGGISDARTYGEVMVNPSSPVVTLSASASATLLLGQFPLPKLGVSSVTIDVYLADAFGLYRTPASPQGRTWLSKHQVYAPGDLNPVPGSFSVDIQGLNLSEEEFGRLTFTATYSLSAGRAVTTNFSTTRTVPVAPPLLNALTAVQDPGGLQLQWTGGTPPFGIFTATTPAGPWTMLTTTFDQNIATPFNGERRFYRVRDGLPPR